MCQLLGSLDEAPAESAVLPIGSVLPDGYDLTENLQLPDVRDGGTVGPETGIADERIAGHQTNEVLRSARCLVLHDPELGILRVGLCIRVADLPASDASASASCPLQFGLDQLTDVALHFVPLATFVLLAVGVEPSVV